MVKKCAKSLSHDTEFKKSTTEKKNYVLHLANMNYKKFHFKYYFLHIDQTYDGFYRTRS